MIVCKVRGVSLLELIVALAICACISAYSIASFLPVQRRLILNNAADHVVLLLQHAKIVSLTEGREINFAIQKNKLDTWQVPNEVSVTSNRSHLVLSPLAAGTKGSAICLCLQHGATSGRAILLNRLARVRVMDINCFAGRSQKCKQK